MEKQMSVACCVWATGCSRRLGQSMAWGIWRKDKELKAIYSRWTGSSCGTEISFDIGRKRYEKEYKYLGKKGTTSCGLAEIEGVCADLSA